jgi:hypothetical protein
MRYKVDTLFHELLHIFLSRRPIESSALLKEHAAEDERVRDHLHLLALQKAVLLKLNEPDALKEVIAVDSALPGGYYKRAWELVNATDTEYLKYIANCRSSPHQTMQSTTGCSAARLKDELRIMKQKTLAPASGG